MSVLGKSRSEAVAAKARQLSGAGALRWIEPDMMVTMDYRLDRLNLYVDKDGRIVRLTCG